MATVSRDGVVIAYQVSSPPADASPSPPPTVVLLHNIMCDRRVFEHAVATLRPRFRVIAVDFRGHGESALGARPFTIIDLVDDVLAVMDQEGAQQATVVGLSIGATVAMELALRAPGRVQRLVLMGADASPDGGVARLRNGLFCQLVMLMGLRWFLLAGVLQTLFGVWFRTQATEQFQVFRERIAAMERRAARASMRAWTGRRPLLEAVGALRIPVRVVVGEQDVSCPLPCGQRLQAVIPGAELVRIPNAGHTMTAERPEETTAAIASFLGV
ncbi:MAG: 3-oxoadipate enol-lactonase [Myxococcales bacterium]|jgi:pimeloyl-ACP methyl ester carboxylesterase|nr:3-oxoadipate enol-lactonase [Myxococcales bacterium]